MKSSLVVLATATLALASCSKADDETLEGIDELNVNCETAKAGEAAVSDESYASMVEAEAAKRVTADPCRAPDLKTPAAGGSLSGGTHPTISFTPSQANCGMGAKLLPERRALPHSPRSLPWYRQALNWLRPVGVAHAHCAAVSGENYWLRITAENETKPIYAALLSVTSHTPSAEIWKNKLAPNAGKKVTMTIQRAVFVKGDIMEGPYTQSTPYSFTITP